MRQRILYINERSNTAKKKRTRKLTSQFSPSLESLTMRNSELESTSTQFPSSPTSPLWAYQHGKPSTAPLPEPSLNSQVPSIFLWHGSHLPTLSMELHWSLILSTHDVQFRQQSTEQDSGQVQRPLMPPKWPKLVCPSTDSPYTHCHPPPGLLLSSWLPAHSFTLISYSSLPRT